MFQTDSKIRLSIDQHGADLFHVAGSHGHRAALAGPGIFLRQIAHHSQRGGHPNPVALAVLNGFCLSDPFVQHSKGAVDMLQKAIPGLCEPDAVAVALKQLDTDIPLQPPNGGGQGGLGYVQRFRRPGNILSLGRYFKIAQLLQLHRSLLLSPSVALSLGRALSARPWAAAPGRSL